MSEHTEFCEKTSTFQQMAKHEEQPIPVYSSLEPVYDGGSQLEEAELRFKSLKDKFVQVFGHPPQIFARSPGFSLWILFCLVHRKVQEN